MKGKLKVTQRNDNVMYQVNSTFSCLHAIFCRTVNEKYSQIAIFRNRQLHFIIVTARNCMEERANTS